MTVQIQLFQERLSYESVKAYATLSNLVLWVMVASSCLIEADGISSLTERTSTNLCIYVILS